MIWPASRGESPSAFACPCDAPFGLQRLYIAIDRDPAGRRAAERLTIRATEAGIAVRVLEPRLGDFNDDLRADGLQALRQNLADQIGLEDRERLER
ncbi:toprim domain-containing protein [Niveispirillum sp.]|uniref:toprim domain-containing protein n=1 Tax=Niveispirillum sp. TaxID=1917217 RepID=UPI001B5818EA|nr:toprim domain-containing protein [Sulfuritalea sp.]MBP7339163.1 toprim domain-containing protein [Niveispirillum sp.]MBP8897189.1 toprim domain-containing protein [Sulfuritalea sp.]MCC6518669.1 toprim domain-containing protein [Tabrizicola sp.]